eukprot:superscaffoldBa00000047_g811
MFFPYKEILSIPTACSFSSSAAPSLAATRDTWDRDLAILFPDEWRQQAFDRVISSTCARFTSIPSKVVHLSEIIGDSYVRHGEERARQTMSSNLGLDAAVQWFGWGGLRWGNLLPFLHQSLRGRTILDILIIVCGSNDLGKIKAMELIADMKQDLQSLHRQFPGTKIILSSITLLSRGGCTKQGNGLGLWCRSYPGWTRSRTTVECGGQHAAALK